MSEFVNQVLACLAPPDSTGLPLHAVRPDGLAAFLGALPPEQAAWLTAQTFSAAAQELVLLPGPHGLAGAVLGLGAARGPEAFGGLAFRLPRDSVWSLRPGDYDPDIAVLGFCLGAYRFRHFKMPDRPPARLVPPPRCEAARQAVEASWMVRDLINAPANLLGPAQLGAVCVDLGKHFGARTELIEGTDLARDYPTVAAVGAGSARPPCVARLSWRGSAAGEDAPHVSLCGKGVCFDSGGYDLKPSSAMLRMKKDMGGAAIVLGIARMIMAADLPIRLSVRIGCVENSVSGTAMRPLDVIRTRSGLTVEIGNTDAEGRLVLCDLLQEAAAEAPALLLDCATLTGAARVALGPDLPALFCNDDAWADAFLASAREQHDPLWRLPLWSSYDGWLASSVADLNNVSTKPFAGAIVGALFLQRFVPISMPWAHLDVYAWNDQTSPARPEGGEAQAMRAIVAAIRSRLTDSRR